MPFQICNILECILGASIHLTLIGEYLPKINKDDETKVNQKITNPNPAPPPSAQQNASAMSQIGQSHFSSGGSMTYRTRSPFTRWQVRTTWVCGWSMATSKPNVCSRTFSLNTRSCAWNNIAFDNFWFYLLLVYHQFRFNLQQTFFLSAFKICIFVDIYIRSIGYQQGKSIS